jgi:polysaccharide deacetylase 2 family uncharacterized protein YibQ
VVDDELSIPLGRKANIKRPGFKLPTAYLPHALAVALGLFICLCAGWALLVNDPTGGEPAATVATGLGPPKPAMPVVVSAQGQVQAQAQAPPQGPRSYDGPDGPAALTIPVPPAAQARAPSQAQAPGQGQSGETPPSGTAGRNTVTIIDGSTGKRQEVPIPASRDPRAPVEQRLLESSRHGAIPRIAPDGVRPAEAYARPVNPAASKKGGPRIAIILPGLGVSANLTQQAIERLPGPVTLALLPYSADVERTAINARAQGHEILLQAPMEPFDYPDNDPGPQTLLTSVAMDQNLDRLYWLMSRFQAYVGVINYMGARFSSTEQALAPVLKETARRGLIFVDDGSSPRSLASQLAGANNLPFVKAEVALDAVPTVAHIDRALARLEAMAREHGVAVGIAAAMPASIERIALWAKTAEGRGVVLVPISAAAIKPKSS